MITVNLWDMDGCLCPSIFDNNRLKNDNRNCLKFDFLRDLTAVRPYPWVEMSAPVVFNDVNVIVTGRLPEHRSITVDWFNRHAKRPPNDFFSVAWNDKLATRADSYQQYVRDKAERLMLLAMQFSHITSTVGIHTRVNVYEDDENVLSRLLDGLKGKRGYGTAMWPDIHLLVVRDGSAPVPF